MPDLTTIAETVAQEEEKSLSLLSSSSLDPCMQTTRKIIASCSYPVQGKCCPVLGVPNGCSPVWMSTMMYHTALARSQYACDNRRWCPFDESSTTCPCYQVECASLLSSGVLDPMCAVSIQAHCLGVPDDPGCRWANVTCPATRFYECATLSTTSSLVIDGMLNYSKLRTHRERKTLITTEAYAWAQEYGCVTGARASPLPATCPCASASTYNGYIMLKACSFDYIPSFRTNPNAGNVASVIVLVVFLLSFYVVDFLNGLRSFNYKLGTKAGILRKRVAEAEPHDPSFRQP